MNRCIFDLNHLILLTEISPNIEWLNLLNSYEGEYGGEELEVLLRFRKLKYLRINEAEVNQKYRKTYFEKFAKIIKKGPKICSL